MLESFAGEFAQQQLATIPSGVAMIAILTWDDYDEKSSGPRERIVAELSGVNWNLL